MPYQTEQDVPATVSQLPITAGQRNAAMVLASVLLLGAAILAPFVQLSLPANVAYIPVVQTLIFAADVTTAATLAALHVVGPQSGILILCSGYLLSGVFALLQTLAFPGAYAPLGVIGDQLNSAAWFFLLWHSAFPCCVIAYSFLKDADLGKGSSDLSPVRTIAMYILANLAIIIILSALATKGAPYLPALFTDTTQMTATTQYFARVVWLLNACALAVVLVRKRSSIDLWIAISLLACLPDLALSSIFSVVRFSLGWYVARGYAFVASSVVMLAILVETILLHARLANARRLVRRERADRLMTVDVAMAALAHQIRQPLAAILSSAEAATMLLAAVPPKVSEGFECAKDVAASVQRAVLVVEGIRDLFARRAIKVEPIDLSHLITDVLNLLQSDLEGGSVSVRTDIDPLSGNIYNVRSSRFYLEQVVMNLVKNAIEAMRSVPVHNRILSISVRAIGTQDVAIEVADAGRGIPADEQAKIFEPFFTTKSNGANMGLGLAISKAIMEELNGDLELQSSTANGSAFVVLLPGDKRRHASAQAQAADHSESARPPALELESAEFSNPLPVMRSPLIGRFPTL